MEQDEKALKNHRQNTHLASVMSLARMLRTVLDFEQQEELSCFISISCQNSRSSTFIFYL